MSNEVKVSIEIDAPATDVWAVVMDPARLKDWVTIHRKLGRVSDEPLRRGSTIEQGLSLRGAPFTVKWTVEDLVVNRSATWEGKGPARSKATTRYKLTEHDGCTRFDYSNEFRAPLGPLGSLASKALVGGLPEREARSTLARLKSLLEQPS